MRIAEITTSWAKAKNIETHFEPSMTSSNDVAKAAASPARLYLCEHQTRGRGRFDRSWADQGQGQLLSTWVWNLTSSPSPMITPRIGLALFKAATATWAHTNWSIKAPNDLYLGNKKVAGLLLEAISMGNTTRLLIGLGLNVQTHPGIAQSGSLSETLPAPILNTESFSHFLSRWHLEAGLVCESPAGDLPAYDHAFLEHALLKNPISPKVRRLEDHGKLVFEDSTTKKWMEL